MKRTENRCLTEEQKEEHGMRKLFGIFMMIVVASFGVLTSQIGHAQETIQGTTIDSWPPYMFLENGTISGIATEIVRTTFQKAGIPLDIKVYPWARAYQMALDEKNTLIYILYRTPERESLFKWVGPIVPSYPMYFYKLKNRSEITINALEDAKKYKVGVVRNVANHKYLLSQGFEEGKNLETVTDPQQNVKKLFAQRIDLLISNELPLMILMKEVGFSMNDVEPCFTPIESDAGYIGLNMQTADQVIQQLQTAFEALQAEGTVATIQEKYIKKYQQ
jgi:polar amino acid transport system substrate-binding protein